MKHLVPDPAPGPVTDGPPEFARALPDIGAGAPCNRGCNFGQGVPSAKGGPAWRVMPRLAPPVRSIGGVQGDGRAGLARARGGGMR